MSVQQLAETLSSGALVQLLEQEHGGFELLHHWQQGEFHHDIVLAVKAPGTLPGPILVIATNCNAGVKEVLCFDRVPAPGALWHRRCPDNAEFEGELPPVLAEARTLHWFDPCKLLEPSARSEYRAEFRERQHGGGWKIRGS